jgi:hypothetical protein
MYKYLHRQVREHGQNQTEFNLCMSYASGQAAEAAEVVLQQQALQELVGLEAAVADMLGKCFPHLI